MQELMASHVYLVYLIWLIGQNQMDEGNKPDEPGQPVPPVPLNYLANKVFLISISDRYYCTELICRPPGVGGAVSGAGGDVTGGSTGAVVTVNVTGTVSEEAPVAVIVTVAL